MSKSINRFLIEKGIKSNAQKITILQMVQWVDEWQEEVKNCSIPVVSNCECKNLPKGEVAISSKAITNPNWEE